MVVLHFLLLRIGIHAVSDGHGGRAVAGPVVFGGFMECFAGSLSGCHGFCDLFWGGSVSEQLHNLTITNPWYNPVEYSGTISQLY